MLTTDPISRSTLARLNDRLAYEARRSPSPVPIPQRLLARLDRDGKHFVTLWTVTGIRVAGCRSVRHAMDVARGYFAELRGDSME